MYNVTGRFTEQIRKMKKNVGPKGTGTLIVCTLCEDEYTFHSFKHDLSKDVMIDDDLEFVQFKQSKELLTIPVFQDKEEFEKQKEQEND